MNEAISERRGGAGVSVLRMPRLAKAATSPPKAARPWDQCSSNSVMFSSLAASLSRISLNVLLVTC
jgi:hypothetical protein